MVYDSVFGSISELSDSISGPGTDSISTILSGSGTDPISTIFRLLLRTFLVEFVICIPARHSKKSRNLFLTLAPYHSSKTNNISIDKSHLGLNST